MSEIESLRAELKAEKERREQAERELDRWRIRRTFLPVNDQFLSELTIESKLRQQAECERDSESLLLATVNSYIRDVAVKVFGDKYGSTGDESAATPDCVKRFLSDLVDRLLSALAAIEKLLDAQTENEKFRAINGLHCLDLSLLHQHDAEVRKPLVEALKASQQMLVACSESAKILKRIDRSGGWQKAEKSILNLIHSNDAALAQCQQSENL